MIHAIHSPFLQALSTKFHCHHFENVTPTWRGQSGKTTNLRERAGVTENGALCSESVLFKVVQDEENYQTGTNSFLGREGCVS